MCRRSESDWVHSQSRAQASSREISWVMAVTLAERTGPSDATDGRASVVPETSGPSAMGTLERAPARISAPPPIPMEKFVIEGGVSLSGTITAAGNKNGALPIMAACLLTEDEVILRNVPRISDVEDMVRLL